MANGFMMKNSSVKPLDSIESTGSNFICDKDDDDHSRWRTHCLTSSLTPQPITRRTNLNRLKSISISNVSPLENRITNDSGNDQSFDHVLNYDFEVVSVYGKDRSSLMSDRYEFDHNKVSDYLRGKSDHQTMLPWSMGEPPVSLPTKSTKKSRTGLKKIFNVFKK